MMFDLKKDKPCKMRIQEHDHDHTLEDDEITTGGVYIEVTNDFKENYNRITEEHIELQIILVNLYEEGIRRRMFEANRGHRFD